MPRGSIMLQFEVTQHLAGRLVRHDIKHSRMGRVRLEWSTAKQRSVVVNGHRCTDSPPQSHDAVSREKVKETTNDPIKRARLVAGGRQGLIPKTGLAGPRVFSHGSDSWSMPPG